MGFLPVLLAPTLAQLFLAPAVPPAAAPSLYYPTAEAFPGAEAAAVYVDAQPAREAGPRLAPVCLFVAALGASAALVRLPGKAANASFRAATSSALRPAARSSAISMMADGEPTVSKEALVDAIAKKAGVSKKTASEVLTATLDVIVDSVSEGSKVSLIGFGTFRAKDRAAREARNPKTGDMIQVAAKTVPTFTFGSKFKEAVKLANPK